MSATVLRYPCACEIDSGDYSCPHVDAAIAKIMGQEWADANAEITARVEAKAEADAVLKSKGDEE